MLLAIFVLLAVVPGWSKTTGANNRLASTFSASPRFALAAPAAPAAFFTPVAAAAGTMLCWRELITVNWSVIASCSFAAV